MSSAAMVVVWRRTPEPSITYDSIVESGSRKTQNGYSFCLEHFLPKFKVASSVVDTVMIRWDPKLLAGYGSGGNHSGSGQLRVRNEFEVSLAKFLLVCVDRNDFE
jgi:hypothetical protein